jgi:hypothetical protein
VSAPSLKGFAAGLYLAQRMGTHPNKSRKPIGTCKLCLRDGVELRESHYIPRALYPKQVKQQFATRRKAGVLKEEIKAYLLCEECEQRLDRNGESEVLCYVAAKSVKSFPLHDKLRLALPREEHPDLLRFAGPDLGIDMDKFAYFAMSIVWRGAVHDWTLVDGSILPKTPLGDFQEEIRRYLLGETPLPSDMVVLVIVCSDEDSRKAWIIPVLDIEENCINFRFLLRGIFLRVLIGYQMPYFYRNLCCTSPRKCLFYGSAKHRMPEIMAIFDKHTSQD